MKAAMNGENAHASHVRDYCEYADATAEAAADDVRRDIPAAVQKEVKSQIGKRQVGIEIDKQSLTKAKAAIKDLFATIGRMGK
jgi:hypothetical protein